MDEGRKEGLCNLEQVVVALRLFFVQGASFGRLPQMDQIYGLSLLVAP
jgi:hypothetical protein